MSQVPKDENIDDPQLGFWKSLSKAIISLPRVLKETLDIREGTDKNATIDDIKNDISFKGHKAWILIASVFIASIGLNTNSTAVVVGAMLISPLMGPILGIGLSISINDWSTLKQSIRNITIATTLSIITSYIYFKISPLSETSSELLSRTVPTLLDVFIAFFGGVAGILAGSRGEKTNVVPGVAIATALMPPLCTAGYGLATLQWEMFFGAFYLYLLNSVFIALATLLVVKFLRFPIVKYVNLKRRKSIHKYITIFVIVVMLPSSFLFYRVVDNSIFQNNVREFISEQINYPGAELVSDKITKPKNKDEKPKIELYFIGEFIPENIIEGWNDSKNDYNLQNVEIEIHQQTDNSENIAKKLSDKIRVGVLEDIYERNESINKSKDEKIEYLEKLVLKYKKRDIPFERISKEVKINHVKLETFGYSEVITSNYEKIDTIPVFIVTWKKGISKTEKKERMSQITEWLNFKLDKTNIQVLEGKN